MRGLDRGKLVVDGFTLRSWYTVHVHGVRCFGVSQVVGTVDADPEEDTLAGRINQQHQQDHQELKSLLSGWAPQPGEELPAKTLKIAEEQASGILRDNMLIHLGAFHGWTVAKDGGNIGLTPCLSVHDLMHGQDDLLGAEAMLPENVVKAIAWDRDRMRKPPTT